MRSSATTSAAENGTPAAPGRRIELTRRDYGWRADFGAMASPCEVHLRGLGRRAAEAVVELVAEEAWRIEDKFSRYRRGNIVDRINTAGGKRLRVDPETARLLTYAGQLTVLSDGRFDITSGLLRQAWTFDGSDAVPNADEVRALLDRIGWQRVEWRDPFLSLPAGMQIDFGGIGKEYAVDRAASLVRDRVGDCMINFGGDLMAIGPRNGSGAPTRSWTIGIESLSGGTAARRISLQVGALATSGDARRFLIREGKRYGHILDPRTGWPVPDAPRSVTVLAATCTQAGMLATFAMLMGGHAETFLRSQDAQFWCLR